MGADYYVDIRDCSQSEMVDGWMGTKTRRMYNLYLGTPTKTVNVGVMSHPRLRSVLSPPPLANPFSIHLCLRYGCRAAADVERSGGRKHYQDSK